MAEDRELTAFERDEMLTTQTELMQKNVGRELVERAVKGDEAAFEQLYMLTYRYVYAVARHYLKNDEDIYDAIQDTFTRVYKSLSKLNEPDAFAWWLRKIAENCAKTALSKRGTADSELSDFESEILGEDPLKSSDVTLDITEVLSSMEESEAELLTHIYYDKLTVAEIARMKGLSHSTVRSRVKAAEKRLRELLSVHGIEKPYYGGEFVAMITTAFRNAIGTNLLSATVAQEILMNVREGDKKKGALIAGVAIADRNRAVLRLASVMVAVAVFFALLIFGIYLIINRLEKKGENKSGRESTPLYTETSSEDRPSGESPSSEENSSEESRGSSGESSSITSGVSSNTSSDLQTTSKPSTPAVFQPDCDPSEYNVMGNMPHNTTHHEGKVAMQGDWFYFISRKGGIYKVKKDGTNKQLLISTGENATGLNVVGDTVYYIENPDFDEPGNVYKMRTDGKERKRVISEPVKTLQVFSNTGYYMVKTYDSLMAKTTYEYKKIDFITGKTETLLTDVLYMAVLTEDYFAYINTDRQVVVFERKTKKEIARFADQKYESFLINGNVLMTYAYNLKVSEGDFFCVYDILNPDKGFIRLPDTDNTVNKPLFYSDYKGGVVGTFGATYHLPDPTDTGWRLPWSPKSAHVLTTFDDGYVYLVNEDSLYRAYPDGTGFEQIV